MKSTIAFFILGLVFLGEHSFAQTGSFGSGSRSYTNYTCRFQGEQTPFQLRVEVKEDIHVERYFTFVINGERTSYQLGLKGCPAGNCPTGESYSNSRGSVKVSLSPRGATGNFDSASFRCTR